MKEIQSLHSSSAPITGRHITCTVGLIITHLKLFLSLFLEMNQTSDESGFQGKLWLQPGSLRLLFDGLQALAERRQQNISSQSSHQRPLGRQSTDSFTSLEMEKDFKWVSASFCLFGATASAETTTVEQARKAN